ncbi:hypothetical protein GCM10010106_23950 [Thermopolyspora flexuosa]|uniref:DUF2812 domain-containing protein n=1 Tax=Thermopolyspora flexuosa TaxID=103836 RepID=A0A543IVB6_9ACTN|nr:hypothetical protein [Thermopolyspora flexuosa]TQM74510.1 hypothetical protein FHX40_1187 [Thermopolyspora flexuosa]GGM76730.1 hypothetical protein GCM10010106_23950 [Thermopolyspora flexuosa]
MSGYFDELTARLREAGVPASRIAVTVDDLRAYLADSGGDPEEEFGPAAAFAEQLAATAGQAAGEAASGERWTWTADIFTDQQRLNEFGEQGWEVQGIDRLGRFVCTRSEEHPQCWEYRREVVPPADRDALTERLAPDGWEPCGTWFFYAYYKRPKAALVGPEAEIASPPPQPGRRIFFSPALYGFVVVAFAAAVALGLLSLGMLDRVDDDDPIASTLFGMLVGAISAILVMGAIGGAAVLVGRRRRRR